MRTRLTALVLITSLATGGIADAATKHKPKPKPKAPVCNVVKDPANDSYMVSPSGGSNTYDPSLEIVSADVATNATLITAVIRVKQLTQSDSKWPLGRKWVFDLQTSTGHADNFTAVDGPIASGNVPGSVTLDYAKNEVRITQKLRDLTFALPAGTVLNNLQAFAYAVVQLPSAAGISFGSNSPVSTEDTTVVTPTTKFVVGTPSCVKVGT